MTAHELARHLVELPDVPVDVVSASLVVRHPDGSTGLVSERKYFERNSDDARPSGHVVAKRIVLHRLPPDR